MTKIKFKGIILRICCFKYKKLRSIFEIKEKNIMGWKVINLYANPNLEKNYIMDDNILTVKCEDTYTHLSTKIIIGFKILTDIYDISEGIIKCDDDLIMNINNLINFLNIKDKGDYVGKNFSKKNIDYSIKNDKLNSKSNTNFLINYYNNHNDDKKYTTEYLKKFNTSIDDLKYIPDISNIIGLGHIYYLSNKSVNIIIKHFLQNDADLNFSIIKENGCYPYICEDIAMGYILFKNGIHFTNYPEMWLNNHYQGFDTEKLEYICVHTNEGNIF